MRTTLFLSSALVVALGAGCASAPRAQTATVSQCAVAAVVTLPEEVVRDPRAPYDVDAPVVAEGADAARGQTPPSAGAPGVVAHHDATVTRGNGSRSDCAIDHASVREAGRPHS